MKIVKRIASLIVVGTIIITVSSCAKKNVSIVVDEETIVDGEFVVDQGQDSEKITESDSSESQTLFILPISSISLS